ncbi:hypothetical protein EVAR_7939_1 [Eumeta japonica]|uniref:Uncharacterized protein n=1 Tax=Eumeta variegata TaxID=151549 RepID=A0A4C1TJD9_EUMVA|nr:hypothetical protein EVAR_7939_1 [Eumeta japonica]
MAVSKSKRFGEPLESRPSSRSLEESTSALPASWEEIGYLDEVHLMEGEKGDEVGSGPPEFSLTRRNEIAKAATSLPYSMKVCAEVPMGTTYRIPARLSRYYTLYVCRRRGDVRRNDMHDMQIQGFVMREHALSRRFVHVIRALAAGQGGRRCTPTEIIGRPQGRAAGVAVAASNAAVC